MIFFVLEGDTTDAFEAELEKIFENIQKSSDFTAIDDAHYHVGFESNASESEVESAPATVDAEAVYENNMLGN